MAGAITPVYRPDDLAPVAERHGLTELAHSVYTRTWVGDGFTVEATSMRARSWTVRVSADTIGIHEREEWTAEFGYGTPVYVVDAVLSALASGGADQ